MTVPNELMYTRDHEWIRTEGDTVVVGITHYAQDQLDVDDLAVACGLQPAQHPAQVGLQRLALEARCVADRARRDRGGEERAAARRAPPAPWR